MELISQYLNNSPSYLVKRVVAIYHEQGLSGLPLMAMLIEDLGIDRHTYRNNYHSTIYESGMHSEDLVFKSILAYIIYLIDYQEFKMLDELLSREGLENFL